MGYPIKGDDRWFIAIWADCKKSRPNIYDGHSWFSEALIERVKNYVAAIKKKDIDHLALLINVGDGFIDFLKYLEETDFMDKYPNIHIMFENHAEEEHEKVNGFISRNNWMMVPEGLVL